MKTIRNCTSLILCCFYTIVSWAQTTPWAISYSTSTNDKGLSIAIAKDGDLIVSGKYGTPGGFVGKFGSSNGSLLWSVKGSAGGSSDCKSVLDNDNNIFLGMEAGKGAKFNDSVINLAGTYLTKLTQQGAALWIKPVLTTSTKVSTFLYFSDLCIDDKNNIYVTGHFRGVVFAGNDTFTSKGKNSHDYYIAKLDSSGRLLWLKQGGGINEDRINSIVVNNGTVYIAGFYGFKTGFQNDSITPPDPAKKVGSQFLLALDTGGQKQWIEHMGFGNEEIKRITIKNNDLYVAGLFKDTTEIDGKKYFGRNSSGFFFKYNLTTRKAELVKTIIRSYNNQVESIEIGKDDDIYICGQMWDFAQFDHVVVRTVYPNGIDMFVACFDKWGELKWVESAGIIPGSGGSGLAMAIDLALAPNGKVYATGTYSGMMYYRKQPNQLSILDGGTSSTDLFVLEIDGRILNSVNSPSEKPGIFPNPFRDQLNVIPAENCQGIKIYNSLGAIVYERWHNYIKGDTISVDMQLLSDGIYYVELPGPALHTFKVVKQSE